MMMLGILVMITALTISAVAIYYSVAGLMTIFAAAAIPIMIMGGALEIGKLVTAVWLHRYWNQATWWLKTYLTTAVVVLMFITSMGIFGFLSKAHIEQTATANEGVAQLERIETEIARQEAVIARAEDKINDLSSSVSNSNDSVQAQIDKEQERIDRAFERIQPAIAQQNQIIEDARSADGNRTKPFEDQLANIQAEILRLENSAREYETSISNLDVDNSNVQPLLDQIAALEEEIIRVTNQLNSGEQQQVRAGQAIIGVTSDGLFGGNTRTALATWVQGQRARITQIQGEVAQVRRDAQSEVAVERERLAGVVADIRERQIPALKTRELDMLNRIDEIRQTESPAIATARDEIQRLRESAESQVAQSQTLINRLREQLAQEDKAVEIDAQIDEQNARIREANTTIDTLTEQRYTLEAEYRKLEAEVGPVKYIAEFIYGETADTNLLEEAVRWVILIIIFVFDPLAVLLLIASQHTFMMHSKRNDDQKELLRLEEREEYERTRAQRIIDNPGYNTNDPAPSQEEEEVDDTTVETTNADADATVRDLVPENDVSVDDGTEPSVEQTEIQSDGLSPDEIARDYSQVEQTPIEKKDTESSEELKQARTQELEAQENDINWSDAKKAWKELHPNETLKEHKERYINGEIDQLPWEEFVTEPKKKELHNEARQSTDPKNNRVKPDLTEVIEPDGYIQNSEQNPNSIWSKIRNG